MAKATTQCTKGAALTTDQWEAVEDLKCHFCIQVTPVVLKSPASVNALIVAVLRSLPQWWDLKIGGQLHRIYSKHASFEISIRQVSGGRRVSSTAESDAVVVEITDEMETSMKKEIRPKLSAKGKGPRHEGEASVEVGGIESGQTTTGARKHEAHHRMLSVIPSATGAVWSWDALGGPLTGHVPPREQVQVEAKFDLSSPPDARIRVKAEPGALVYYANGYKIDPRAYLALKVKLFGSLRANFALRTIPTPPREPLVIELTIT